MIKEQPREPMSSHAESSFSTWSNVQDHHHPIRLDESISIGIAAYGNSETTRRCLEALFKSAEGDFELILINDNSPDEGRTSNLYRWAKSIHKNTSIYESTQQNIEYSGSVDLVLSQARGDKIMFVSNDIFVTPYYLGAMLEASQSISNWGILRGSSNFVDNGLASHNIQPGTSIESLDDIFAESQTIYALYSTLHVTDLFLTGDAFVVNRDLINKIGVFDPLFYGYFADHDYGLRSQIAGLEIILVPGAYAFHQAGINISYLSQADQLNKTSERFARVYENWARFKLKYGISVETPYTSMHDIEWQTLSSAPFNPDTHHISPKSYESLRVPPNS
jgi:GT2 family glycosyltransferase